MFKRLAVSGWTVPVSFYKKGEKNKMVARKKTEDEYIDVLTSVRIERETDRRLKLTVKELKIAQSTFIRSAIKTAIASAGVA